MFPPAAWRIHALIHDSILNVDTGEGYYLRAGGRGLGPDAEEVQAGNNGRGTRNKVACGARRLVNGWRRPHRQGLVAAVWALGSNELAVRLGAI